jgi:hypothetical protein
MAGASSCQVRIGVQPKDRQKARSCYRLQRLQPTALTPATVEAGAPDAIRSLPTRSGRKARSYRLGKGDELGIVNRVLERRNDRLIGHRPDLLQGHALVPSVVILCAQGVRAKMPDEHGRALCIAFIWITTIVGGLSDFDAMCVHARLSKPSYREIQILK